MRMRIMTRLLKTLLGLIKQKRMATPILTETKASRLQRIFEVVAV